MRTSCSIYAAALFGRKEWNSFVFARRPFQKRLISISFELAVANYLSTSSSNSFKFKIEGNNFSAADDKDLKIAIPAGFLGIYAPDGTTNFDAYLNSINTNAETEITGSPEVFRI